MINDPNNELPVHVRFNTTLHILGLAYPVCLFATEMERQTALDVAQLIAAFTTHLTGLVPEAKAFSLVVDIIGPTVAAPTLSDMPALSGQLTVAPPPTMTVQQTADAMQSMLPELADELIATPPAEKIPGTTPVLPESKFYNLPDDPIPGTTPVLPENKLTSLEGFTAEQLAAMPKHPITGLPDPTGFNP